MDRISLKAYAKVNLSLDVTGKLDNGYHTLRSVMQAVNLFDELNVSIDDNAQVSEIILKLDSDGDEIPTGKDNLACRAAEAMIKTYKPDFSGRIEINLKKSIPVAAGLAGGSTDAAAVMLALSYLWKIKDGLLELTRLAKTIGADVPFCLISNAKNNPLCGFSNDPLSSSAALAEGIGELLQPIPSLEGTLIFVKPRIPLSTPVVYSLYDEKEDLVTKRPDTQILLSALKENAAEKTTASLEIIKANMVNVLEPVVRSAYPVVKETLDSLLALMPDGKVFMSGSGPTVVAYLDSHEDALEAMPLIMKTFENDADIYMMPLL